jgi:glycosyltransferase involved in cell wall biosynthesis
MQTDKPVHTFVIVAYKESKYLEECIRSVVNQTVSSKIVIATSTPNDYILSVAKKYDLEVRINQHTGSIGKDWNFAYQCSDTRYVTLAHQDDIYKPDFAEQCIHAASVYNTSNPLMVFTKSVVYADDTEVRISIKNIIRWLLIFPFHFKRCIRSKRIKKSVLLFSNSISCPGVFYVKDNLTNFSFNEVEKYILDWRAWFDMSRMDGAFIYVSAPLHIHREHKESATSTTHLHILQQEEYDLLTTIWGNKWMPRIITRLLLMAK